MDIIYKELDMLFYGEVTYHHAKRALADGIDFQSIYPLRVVVVVWILGEDWADFLALEAVVVLITLNHYSKCLKNWCDGWGKTILGLSVAIMIRRRWCVIVTNLYVAYKFIKSAEATKSGNKRRTCKLCPARLFSSMIYQVSHHFFSCFFFFWMYVHHQSIQLL